MGLRELLRQNDRDDRGFNMLELIMVVVVIGILGGIGFAIYQGVSGEARGTVLDSNITTAAEQLQAVLSVDPTLAGEGQVAGLSAEMTNRTNFVWEGDTTSNAGWDFVTTDDASVVRFQWLTAASTPLPPTATATGVAPAVNWIVDGSSAVRLHLRNQENQWRCALIVLKPSISNLKGKAAYNNGTAVFGDPAAKLMAAELSGLWFDGGSTAASTTDYTGLHDCSPVGHNVGGALKTDGGGCTSSGAVVLTTVQRDACLPTDANTWDIFGGDSEQLDPASTAKTNLRTLHGAIGALDSNA